MAFHHLALATRDLRATHDFYTGAMGFRLVKTEVTPTENPGGWARHVFYDTGGDGLMAFWEINDPAIADFDPAISTGAGLPAWVNHIAFHATPETLADCRNRWLDHGIDVVEIDHGFCVSIYANDPNGILVEWCADTRVLNDDDRREAEALLFDPSPPLSPEPTVTIYAAADRAATPT
jgi:catechol 2,3-dioxygenase-like lactoylglutathione lyase family enzyme